MDCSTATTSDSGTTLNSLRVQSGEESSTGDTVEVIENVAFGTAEEMPSKVTYAAIYDDVSSDLFTKNYELGDRKSVV